METEIQNKSDSTQVSEKEDTSRGLRERFLNTAGWFMLFFQSVPALFIWGGLMTLPFLVYLIIMFFSFGSVEVPLITERGGFYFIEALDVFFFGGNRIPEMIVSYVGLFILLYTVIFLRFRKPEGLVTSGPYQYVRHPQYLGVIVFTANLTSRCFRETLGDVGWIGVDLTLMLWFGTIIAYIILATIEEKHLIHKFGSEYEIYRDQVGFIFPYLKARSRILETIITLTLSMALMFGTAYLAEIFHP
jgi:protein-S-isoprenylcysteine O-methyltransferase Ste14